MTSIVAEINETKSNVYLALMSIDVEDIFLQLYQVYFITIRTHNRDFIMIMDPIPHHICAPKSRVKQNLFISS